MALRFPTKDNGNGAASNVVQTAKPTQAQIDTEYMRLRDEARAAGIATPAPTPAAPPPPMRPPTQYPDEPGVGGPPPEDDGSGGRLPYADTFPNLTAGRHTFLCCVESITHWDGGPALGLRVRVGPDAGREFKWEQTPPRPALADPEGKFATYWKRTLFNAYAAGGWTAEPSPARGWPGWPRSASGSYIPPYVDFFVVEIDGVMVPVMLHVTVQVDAGYEARPKVVAVRHHTIDGALVQAPMPRKVTPWIAERHRWSGTRKDITVKAKDDRPASVVPSTALVWDQIPRGVGGMLTLKDCT